MKYNLVHNDGKVPSIFFPKGRMSEGGTCQFASEKCLEWCPCTTAPNELETSVYKYFKEHTAIDICTRIHMELLDRNKLFLQWFAWGDCPAAMTEKIAWIILRLHKEGITQMGFTRNIKLWEKVEYKVVFGLTVEDKSKIKEYCGKGLVAWPNYEEGKAELYKGFERVQPIGACWGPWYKDTDKPAIYEASCDICSDNLRGCFTPRKQKQRQGYNPPPEGPRPAPPKGAPRAPIAAR